MDRIAYYIRVLVLVGFVAGHTGIPTLEFPGRGGGGRYPCDGHGCGCTSAEQCWHRCCCTSLADRLAWADEHHVQAPADLIAFASLADTRSDKCAEKTSCCDHREKSNPETTTEHQTPRVRWTLAIAAMKCRGNTLHGLMASNPIIPAEDLSSDHRDLTLTGRVSIIDDFLTTLSPAPPLSFG